MRRNVNWDLCSIEVEVCSAVVEGTEAEHLEVVDGGDREDKVKYILEVIAEVGHILHEAGHSPQDAAGNP